MGDNFSIPGRALGRLTSLQPKLCLRTGQPDAQVLKRVCEYPLGCDLIAQRSLRSSSPDPARAPTLVIILGGMLQHAIQPALGNPLAFEARNGSAALQVRVMCNLYSMTLFKVGRD